ncbi:hypothetical protein [Aquimixticola soesokkakensis]|uniref:hypothetical protein n=1 Tax=Aquimixticola soesokkakensis TaxID=1519096 RepID=UPI000A26DF1F|nr:hypothetical protein [Aquimixticola soesokkakensis]
MQIGFLGAAVHWSQAAIVAIAASRTGEIGATPEEALHFFFMSFTALGSGEIILPAHWRILSGMMAVNGFRNIGMIRGLVIEMMRQVRLRQRASVE